MARMISNPVPVLSPELMHAARCKTGELATLLKSTVAASTQSKSLNLRTRVKVLVDEVEKSRPHPVFRDSKENEDLSAITRFIEQAATDRSIPDWKFESFERTLQRELAQRCNRLSVAQLQASLLDECLTDIENCGQLSKTLQGASFDEEYELVEEDYVEQASEHFESKAFESIDTDGEEIQRYLSTLFPGEPGQRALSALREEVQEFGESILTRDDICDEEDIEWNIRDLLKNELIADDKRAILEGYLRTPSALAELATTLGLKTSIIRIWDWRNADEGLDVKPRLNKEGKTCMVVEEEIVEMIFLHRISSGWSATLHRQLQKLVKNKDVWKWGEKANAAELDKRDYYLAPTRQVDSPPPPSTYGTYYPPPPPPPKVVVSMNRACMPPPPPPPPPPADMNYRIKKAKRSKQSILYNEVSNGPSLDSERQEHYVDNFVLRRLPREERHWIGVAVDEPKEQQEKLIKYLTTEMHMCDTLDGGYVMLKFDYDSFATSLPHNSILAVLKFIGMPDFWLDFFRKFLAAPLNIGPTYEDGTNHVRIRRCGVPVGHGFERFFGEILLFFQDLAINQQSQLYPYRLRDQTYLIGDVKQLQKAYRAGLHEFKSIMGLRWNLKKCSFASPELQEFNLAIPKEHFEGSKTDEELYRLQLAAWDRGRARGEESLSPLVDDWHRIWEIENRRAADCVSPLSIGLLQHYGPGWVINEKGLQCYITHVKKQLDSSRTVLSWIRTWNATVGTYAAHLFGPITTSTCFGKDHLDRVFEAYNKIHEAIFPDSDLTTHLRKMIRPHVFPFLLDFTYNFEAIIYLPISLGGLGVRNPYTTLNLARANISSDPATPLNDYLAAERTAYDKMKAKFESLTPDERQKRLDAIYPSPARDAEKDAAFPSADFDKFMPFYEFIKHRATLPQPIPTQTRYHDPAIPFLPSLHKIYNNFVEAPEESDINNGVSSKVETEIERMGMSPRDFKQEDLWTMQLWGEEAVETYGGLRICEREWLAWEALRAVRGVEGEEEDGDGSDVASDYSDV